mmetsp:Transcript_38468/g.86304  ORF Transcript_38468/g.86304 Transcript_38468/m.86304 type:complete len:284 (+) Transcript_38468:2007-2858(+)
MFSLARTREDFTVSAVSLFSTSSVCCALFSTAWSSGPATTLTLDSLVASRSSTTCSGMPTTADTISRPTWRFLGSTLLAAGWSWICSSTSLRAASASEEITCSWIPWSCFRAFSSSFCLTSRISSSVTPTYTSAINGRSGSDGSSVIDLKPLVSSLGSAEPPEFTSPVEDVPVLVPADPVLTRAVRVAREEDTGAVLLPMPPWGEDQEDFSDMVDGVAETVEGVAECSEEAEEVRSREEQDEVAGSGDWLPAWDWSGDRMQSLLRSLEAELEALSDTLSGMIA